MVAIVTAAPTASATMAAAIEGHAEGRGDGLAGLPCNADQRASLVSPITIAESIDAASITPSSGTSIAPRRSSTPKCRMRQKP